MLSHEAAGVREAGSPFSVACASHLVPLALQVDVLLVRLHLQLLHFALQLAVGLLQIVVVSKSRKTARDDAAASVKPGTNRTSMPR